jgi:hypothetical protein
MYSSHCFDPENPLKQQRAKDLVAGNDWFLSWQVVQEFAAVALHKFKVPLQSEDLQDYIELRLWPKCRVFPGRRWFSPKPYRFRKSLGSDSTIA